MKVLILFLCLVLFSGCERKSSQPDPEIERMMKAQITCIKCKKTAERQDYKRVNQILVQCPGCQKVFPVKNK